MNRRKFLRTSAGATAAVLVMPITGCSLKGDAQDVLDTLTAIFNSDPTAVWAPDLEIAIQDITTAIADWNGSSVNCELQSGVTIASAILDSIPLGLTIDLIITIAIAGIDTLLADIAPCTTTALAKKLSRRYNGSFHRGTPQYMRYYGQFKAAPKWHVGSDVKSAFNKAAKENGLTAAGIK